MSRNFGLGSRDMKSAGYFALENGMQSFSSIATMYCRWKQFAMFVRREHGVNRMEQITTEMMLAYGKLLAAKVERSEMSPQTAQTYVSAANRVLEIARGDCWAWVSPTKDCGIKRRSGVATENRAISHDDHCLAKAKVSERTAALLDVLRVFGLRFEEGAKLNACRAHKEAMRRSVVTISDGTKGGRARMVPISPERAEMQFSALERAVSIQRKDRSLIPASESYIIFKRRIYREIKIAEVNFHAERHAYAQNRYEVLVGAPCPVVARIRHGQKHYKFLSECLRISEKQAKEIDHKARKQIAEELGHGRVEVTNAYLG